jgi:four helix bundle protein
MSIYGGFRDLKVYQLSFNLAMEIFYESKKFPPEEKYSLTDQIRRASRSVPGNIGEGRMLGGMIAHPERFSN